MTSETTTHNVAWTDANTRRLARQGLIEPLNAAIPDVVAAMVGAHAQVMSAAELSIGLRMHGVTRTHVRKALWEDRSLVKTYGPRGTVHLLPARDLSLWIGALGTIPAKNAMSGDARLTPERIDAVVAAIGKILGDGELTIDELDRRVIDATGPWAAELVMPAFGGYWPRWRQAIGAAAGRGALCFGPNRGRKVTYTSPRRWLPDISPADSDEAQAWLVREYLTAYGPATPANFAKWMAAPVSWANDALAANRESLERVELDGSEAWVVRGDGTCPSEAPPGVRLLPYFDPFIVASQPRERLFPGAAANRALAGGQAGNYPVLLVNGIVSGIWHQRRSGKRVAITVEPFGALTASQREALEVEIPRIGEIVEATPRLTIGPVTVGSHA